MAWHHSNLMGIVGFRVPWLGFSRLIRSRTTRYIGKCDQNPTWVVQLHSDRSSSIRSDSANRRDEKSRPSLLSFAFYSTQPVVSTYLEHVPIVWIFDDEQVTVEPCTCSSECWCRNCITDWWRWDLAVAHVLVVVICVLRQVVGYIMIYWYAKPRTIRQVKYPDDHTLFPWVNQIYVTPSCPMYIPTMISLGAQATRRRQG